MVITTNCRIEIKREKNGVFEVVKNSVSAFIEPASDGIIALYDDGSPGGQLFTIFSNYTNIEIGDKISTRNTNYTVRGVKKFDSFLGSHIEVVVREWKNS